MHKPLFILWQTISTALSKPLTQIRINHMQLINISLHISHSFPHFPLWFKVQPTPKPQTSKALPAPQRADRLRCSPQMLGRQPRHRRAGCGLFWAQFNVCLRDPGSGQMLLALLQISEHHLFIHTPRTPAAAIIWGPCRLKSSVAQTHTHTCTLRAVPEVF